ncbi:hypothetical protein [Sphingomonas xinjiangensis]|uniref:Uncharacterized protein n=1 Tax=Sphingomonas xinjiangensis TaxID=643568 RepID=A0A840YCF0_9SPHN|nr:hypothetical protein [Sphingomonas xinjiangensis]MBB5709689.1 hypothetical protein [Sphingomonas xinjiangensis]
MDIYYTKGFTKMMAMRQGLQRAANAPHEMPARRSMIDYTEGFRWIFSPALQEWIDRNAVAKIWLRFNVNNEALIVCAENEIDLTMLATSF